MARLTRDAQKAGIPLSGEGGLLKQLTKMVLETALQGEMDAHLGYGKHEPAGRNTGNSRNGTGPKTVVTYVGPVQIEVPRDRDASFTPRVVAKRQRCLSGVDDLVISLTARGLTSGEICAHLAEVYGTSVSKETISVITDRMLDTMAEWQARPLDAVYPVLFVDCIYMKIRDGQVANRPVYVVLGVTCDGGSDVLGLWVGDSTGEGVLVPGHPRARPDRSGPPALDQPMESRAQRRSTSPSTAASPPAADRPHETDDQSETVSYTESRVAPF